MSSTLDNFKARLGTNVLNDATAAPFFVSFSQLPAAKKATENRAAMTSLRSFIFLYNFSEELLTLCCWCTSFNVLKPLYLNV